MGARLESWERQPQEAAIASEPRARRPVRTRKTWLVVMACRPREGRYAHRGRCPPGSWCLVIGGLPAMERGIRLRYDDGSPERSSEINDAEYLDADPCFAGGVATSDRASPRCGSGRTREDQPRRHDLAGAG